MTSNLEEFGSLIVFGPKCCRTSVPNVLTVFLAAYVYTACDTTVQGTVIIKHGDVILSSAVSPAL